jgi:hypothetical protein
MTLAHGPGFGNNNLWRWIGANWMSVVHSMSKMRRIIEKLPLATNGEALVGMTFILAGLIIGREGVLKLASWWKELVPYLPLSLPSDVPQRILGSFPLICNIFISTVGSICAVLIGALWVLSGLGNAIQSRKTVQESVGFHSPAMAAESLRRGMPIHWDKLPWVMKIAGDRWPVMRSITPVSHDILKELFRCWAKLLFWGSVIAVVTYIIQMVPSLLKAVFHRPFILLVPSPRSLYFLLAFVALLDLVIGLSLVPFASPQFERSSQSVPVKGRGDPHLLFALIEEGCRLLTPRGVTARSPVRLEEETNPQMKGTLVENHPTISSALGPPAAYLCLPLMLILWIMGFSRLIHFQRPALPMAYTEFAALHLMDYALQVAFAIGIILCGLHFAEWARQLFGIRRYSSFLLFCQVSSRDQSMSGETANGSRPLSDRFSGELRWRIMEGVDDQFAGWAKQPRAVCQLQVEAFWGEAISEAASLDAPRHLRVVRRSQILDDAVARILDIPFRVDFEVEQPPTEARTPGNEARAGGKRGQAEPPEPLA